MGQWVIGSSPRLRGHGPDTGSLLQEIQCCLVTNLCFKPIETGLLRQYLFDLLLCPPRLRRDFFNLTIDLFIGYSDIFLISNVLEDQRTLHIAYRLLLLVLANLAPIHIQALRVDSLTREIPQKPLHADLQLPLDQRFWKLKLVVVFKPFQKLFPHLLLGMLGFVLLEILTNLRSQLFDRLVIAEPLGELIVDFRNILLLDDFDLHCVLDRLTRESLFGIVVAVRDRERLFIVHFCPEKVLGELFQGCPAADFAYGFFGADRRLTRFGQRTGKRDFSEVAFLDRTIFFDRRQFGRLFLKFLQRSIDFGFFDLRRDFFDRNINVVRNVEVWIHFESCLEAQRLSDGVVDTFEVGRLDDIKLPFFDSFAEVLRQ